MFAALAWAGWLRWAEPLVDWGRQVYLPWQIVAGKVLYRDLASTYGPLSPYFNAALFRVFGTSIRTLVLADLALLALATALLFRIFRAVATRWTATAVCVAFLAVFGFGHDRGLGNYNWVCPYCHEITHGMLLSLAAIVFLWRYVRKGGLAHLALAGVACGAVALTKPEVFVACLAAVACGVAGAWAIDAPPLARRLAGAGALVAGLAAAPLAAFGLFLTVVPARAALLDALGAWPPVFNPGVRSLPFYAIGVGARDGVTNGLRLAVWAALLLAYLALVWAVGVVVRRRGWRPLPAAIALGSVACAVLGWFLLPTLWIGVAKPLPVVLAALAWLGFARALGRDHDPGARRAALLFACLTLFGLVALAKMAFTVYLGHFGFVLAAPGALVSMVALVELLPRAANARGSSRPVVFAGGAALAVFVVASHAASSLLSVRQKSAAIGSGADRIMATPAVARAVNAMLELVGRETGAGETLAVLPEGALLNYLAKRPSPTPFVMLTPTEFVNYGDGPVVQAFRARPPAAILYAPPPGPQMGVGYLGSDYGRPLIEWVKANYSVVARCRPSAADGSAPAFMFLRRTAAVRPNPPAVDPG